MCLWLSMSSYVFSLYFSLVGGRPINFEGLPQTSPSLGFVSFLTVTYFIALLITSKLLWATSGLVKVEEVSLEVRTGDYIPTILYYHQTLSKHSSRINDFYTVICYKVINSLWLTTHHDQSSGTTTMNRPPKCLMGQAQDRSASRVKTTNPIYTGSMHFC